MVSQTDKSKIEQKTRTILTDHSCFCPTKRKSTREVAKLVHISMDHLTIPEIELEVILLRSHPDFVVTKFADGAARRICLVS